MVLLTSSELPESRNLLLSSSNFSSVSSAPFQLSLTASVPLLVPLEEENKNLLSSKISSSLVVLVLVLLHPLLLLFLQSSKLLLVLSKVSEILSTLPPESNNSDGDPCLVVSPELVWALLRLMVLPLLETLPV